MINYRKFLELHFDGISQRTIRSSTGHSRNKISEVIQRTKKLEIENLNDTMTNSRLETLLFPEKQAIEKGFFPVDWEIVHKELQKKNVTLSLLHLEYSLLARESKKIPYAYRTFCEKYGNYAKKYKLTMPIRRKPGEIMEVDWAGSTLKVTDRSTGEDLKAYVFIAALPYSQYSYVEAFLDMKSSNWLIAHIHALEYFGGVLETLYSGLIVKTRDSNFLMNLILNNLLIVMPLVSIYCSKDSLVFCNQWLNDVSPSYTC